MEELELPALEDIALAFPSLEIVGVVGSGGMGVVYEARHVELDRPVALKVLLPELAGQPQYTGRFQREARAMAKMQHPNIVGVYDSGTSARSGYRYLVMEYVEGATLFDLITRRKVRPRHVTGLVVQICDGLCYAHSKGISHLDIKPANILIDTCGTVKISDFGLALDASPAADGSVLARLGENLGTPDYTAPERKVGGQGDQRSDIYSVGVLCYELLTGQRPRGALHSPFYTPPSRAIPGVDERYDTIIAQCIDQMPKRRLGSIDELKALVEAKSATGASPVQAGGGR